MKEFRELTARAIAGQEGLKQEFGRLFLKKDLLDDQLATAYLALIAHLLHYDPLPIVPLQMPSGAAFPCHAVPEPASLAELGSLWMILGERLKNEALLYAGLKIATWQLHTLDAHGLPHLSLWGEPRRYQEIGTYNHLLLTLAYRLTADPRFFQLASGDPPLLSLIPEKRPSPITLSARPFLEEMTVGLLKYPAKGWSAACTLSGYNSGFFSYHKAGVAILNAGPHVGPLDQWDGFGIERACSLRSNRFNEIVWEKAPYHFRLKGWTKLFALPTWMHLDILYETQKITVCTHLQEDRPHEGQMVLYCKAEQATIGGKEVVRAASLKKYQGKAQPLEFRTGEETLFLEPGGEEMQLIPLSGRGDFWGADFLVAFPLDGFECHVK